MNSNSVFIYLNIKLDDRVYKLPMDVAPFPIHCCKTPLRCTRYHNGKKSAIFFKDRDIITDVPILKRIFRPMIN